MGLKFAHVPGQADVSPQYFVLGCCVLLCFGGFAFWFLFSACGDFVRAYWTMRLLYQFTLEAPQSADGHVYALIN